MLCRVVLFFLLLSAIASDLALHNASAQNGIPTEGLSPGLHLGYGTFSPISGEQLKLLDERIEEATAAGMDVARIMVDWAELETAVGVIDQSSLNAQLERVPNGTRLFLTLSVTDVDRYSVSADLLSTEGSLRQPLNDPAVTNRYFDLLAEIVPGLIAEHGLFALSIANEPDVLLSDRPFEEATALAKFTALVNSYADEHFPGLALTMTISGGGVHDAPGFVSELIAATDVATFNWGCVDLATFQASKIDDIPDEIESLREAADGREILIQELSCPSGYTDSERFFGATPEFQAAWFASFFAAMSEQEQFRAAFVFDLVDWPEDLATIYTEIVRAEGLTEIADRYEELQRTWGLLTFDDLGPKPAWSVFLESIRNQ